MKHPKDVNNLSEHTTDPKFKDNVCTNVLFLDLEVDETKSIVTKQFRSWEFLVKLKGSLSLCLKAVEIFAWTNET